MMLSKVEPMLARTVARIPVPAGERGGWGYEPKWDGWRAYAAVEAGNRVRLASRHGTDLTAYFPDVAAAAARWLPAQTVVDGELVRWHPQGRLDFPALQRRVAAGRRVNELASAEPCHLVVFDALMLGGRDLRGHTLARRRGLLEELFAAVPGRCALTLGWHTTDPQRAQAWVRELAPAGIEGVVIKARGQPYRPGRHWLKYKRRVTTPAIIGGVTGTLRQPECLIVGRYTSHSGRLRVAGRTAMLTRAQAAELEPLLTRPGAAHPWPPTLPAHQTGGLHGHEPLAYTRVRPTLVAEIRADTAAEHGRWRHTLRYDRLRLDLTPTDVPTDLDID